MLAKHDSRQTLHYVDPPYELSTRGNNNGVRQKYKFELTSNQHIDLATCLHALDGMMVLSGYGCDLYDEELYHNWYRTERETHADGARVRTEVLWLNEAAVQAMELARTKLAPQPQQQALFLPPPPLDLIA